MAITSTLTIAGDVGGAPMNSTIRRSADGAIRQSITLPQAKAGTLSTRTSDSAGTLTLGAGHGITDGNVIFIFWTGGMAYNATVGTVAGTSVPFTGASGDALPAQSTAITAAVRTSIDADFDADLMVALGAVCTKRAGVVLMASAVAELVLELTASEAYLWANDSGVTNPLAGDTIDIIYAGHADSSAEATLNLGVLYDSTL